MAMERMKRFETYLYTLYFTFGALRFLKTFRLFENLVFVIEAKSVQLSKFYNEGQG